VPALGLARSAHFAVREFKAPETTHERGNLKKNASSHARVRHMPPMRVQDTRQS
jgi:hypothetical protein